jgi:hypothetical protein
MVLISVVIPFSCNPKQSSDNLDKTLVTSEVKAMFDNYHNDIKAGGLTAEFKYLDQSNEFFWVPPGYTSALSYDSVRAILENNSKLYLVIDFHWDTLQIFPLTNSIASYSGIVEGTMTDTSGVKSTVRIIESGTVIKSIDGWKLLNGQSAALSPN